MTLWQAIKLSDWSGRFLAAAACLAIVVNAVALVLLIATGVLGGGWAWRPGVDILATIALAYIALRYVYWQQRALQAEKFAIGERLGRPLPGDLQARSHRPRHRPALTRGGSA